MLSFADDTTVFHSGPDLNTLFNDINKDLDKLFHWLCANKLCLNVNKSKYMIFSPTTINTNLDIKIRNEVLKRIDSTTDETSLKFLGIHMDEHLTWNAHISAISTKLIRAIFCINKIKHFLPFEALLTLYYSLIHCHFSYGILAWGNSHHLDRLIKLQKRAIRIVCVKPYRYHTDPLFKKHNIIKVQDLYQLNVHLFMFDYKNNTLPISFRNCFKTKISTIRTRNPNQLLRERPRTKFSSRLPLHNFPIINNDLPLQLCTLDKRKPYKKAIVKIMLDSYKEQISCSNSRCEQCHGIRS